MLQCLEQMKVHGLHGRKKELYVFSQVNYKSAMPAQDIRRYNADTELILSKRVEHG